MSLTLPPFDSAVDSLREFLRSEGLSDQLVWVFRDDLWLRYARDALLRLPLAPDNEAQARKLYAEGSARGLARLLAVVGNEEMTGVTVVVPADEPQGWYAGLKLSIALPLPRAKIVGPGFWHLLRWHPGFRRFQRWGSLVSRRRTAE